MSKTTVWLRKENSLYVIQRQCLPATIVHKQPFRSQKVLELLIQDSLQLKRVNLKSAHLYCNLSKNYTQDRSNGIKNGI